MTTHVGMPAAPSFAARSRPSNRGRLSAINLVFVAGGPQLGQVESGVVADLWSPEASVVSGGLACVGMVFVAHALAPEVARYRADLQHPPTGETD